MGPPRTHPNSFDWLLDLIATVLPCSVDNLAKNPQVRCLCQQVFFILNDTINDTIIDYETIHSPSVTNGGACSALEEKSAR